MLRFSRLAKRFFSTNLPVTKANYLAPLNGKTGSSSDLTISHKAIQVGRDKYAINLSLNATTDIVKPATFVCALDVSGSMGESCAHESDKEGALFSKMDFMKHSMKTIVHCLRPEDRLGIVTFTSNASRLMEPTFMDAKGKQSALSQIDRMRPMDMTNLGDGLNMSLDDVDKLKPKSGENVFSLLLSDGESNQDSSRGPYADFIARCNQSPLLSNVHTFGYGYSINSMLLNQIARRGSGVFGHIPDHSLCSSVIVNFISNCFATAINRVDMRVKANDCKEVTVLGNSVNEKGVLNVGAIQSGQPQNIMVATTVTGSDPNLRFYFDYDGKTVEYVVKDLLDNPSLRTDLIHSVSDGQTINRLNLPPEDMAFQMYKGMLITIIEAGLTSGDLEETRKPLDALYRMIGESIKVTPPGVSQDHLIALQNNIKHSDPHLGQIGKAFSKQDWFDKWGVHYLKYFVRSHQLQVCSNFKDPSLQVYGGPLFKELRSEVEYIFSQIPAPKPSLSSTPNQPYQGNFQQSFYRASNPCFSGNCIVKMADRPDTLVKDLKKGDHVLCPDGKMAKIVCVVRTKVAGGSTKMVLLKNKLFVSPYHPIKYEGKWQFPCKIKEPIQSHVDYVYSFVLDQNHVMIINGYECICLGHGITNDPVLAHKFYGTQKCIDELKTKKGFDQGLVEITNYSPKYDADGLIASF